MHRFHRIIQTFILIREIMSPEVHVITSESNEPILLDLPLEAPRTFIKESMVLLGHAPFDFHSRGYKLKPILELINTESQRKAFGRWFLQMSPTSNSRFFSNGIEKSEVKERIDRISKEDVRSCLSVECCKFISDLFSKLNDEARENISPKCLKVIAEDVVDSNTSQSLQYLQFIPESVVTANAPLLTLILEDYIHETDFPRSLATKLLLSTSSCAILSTRNWEKIIASTKAALITSKCLRAGQANFSKIKSNVAANRLSDKIFEDYNNALPEGFITKIRPNQLRGFAFNMDDAQNPGRYLPLSQLGKNASGLTLRLLLGYLYADFKHKLDLSLEAWGALPKNFFEDLKSEDIWVISSALQNDLPDDTNNFQHRIPPGHLQYLVKYPLICRVFKSKVMTKRLKISNECFSQLSPVAQATAIVSKVELPPDALSGVNSAKVKGWKYQGKAQLEILQLAASRSDIKQLISNLGDKVNIGHPCQLINASGQLEKLPILQENMSTLCLQNLNFKISGDQYEKFSPRLKYMDPLLMEEMPPQFWRKVTPDMMKLLISNNKFCGSIGPNILSLINKDAFQSITPGCFNEINSKESLPKDIVQSFPRSALVQVDNQIVDSRFLSKLTPEQLSTIGTDNKDDSKNVALAFEVDTLKGYTPQHLGNIPDNVWRGLSPSLFSAIDSQERLRAVKNVGYWREDQVRHIPEDIIQFLTPHQARLIGSSIPIDQGSLLYLASKSFSGETQAALNERFEENGIRSNKSLTTPKNEMLIIISVIIIIIIATMMVIIFRKRMVSPNPV